MFGKAGMIEVSDASELIGLAPALTKPLQIDLEINLAPVRRLIADAPNLPTRCWLVQNYELFTEYHFAIEQRAALATSRDGQAVVKGAWSRLRHGFPDLIIGGVFGHCRYLIWMNSRPSIPISIIEDRYRSHKHCLTRLRFFPIPTELELVSLSCERAW